MKPEISVIIVSYNTREMTLKAIETLYQNSDGIALQVIVWDNNSHDGSSDAVAEAFPQIELHRSNENIGFAAANNRAAETAQGEWLLLLNSDTETLPGAISNLLNLAKANPEAGIFGGKTIFADGTLNATSCFNRMTVWSLFCYSTGLSRVFKGIKSFDPERISGPMMDSVRHVDIVTGCFLMLKTKLWQELVGFDLKFFMYSEETDLCLRAGAIGYRPMITPDATIIHHGGASKISSAVKQVQIYRGKATIIRQHFGSLRKPFGLAMLWFTALNRHAVHSLLGWVGKRRHEQGAMWKSVWEQRKDWIQGY